MRTFSRILLAGLVALLAAPVLAADPVSPSEVSDPISWGTAKHVTKLRHLWFADQPDLAGFEAAKAAGVRVVVNLRPASELDWDERAAVEKLGLVYYQVPVSGPRFDPAAFDRIEELVSKHESEPVLLHCSTSNRVGGWLATHLVREHGMPVEDAIAVGRRAGITKEEIAERVRGWAREQAPQLEKHDQPMHHESMHHEKGGHQ